MVKTPDGHEIAVVCFNCKHWGQELYGESTRICKFPPQPYLSNRKTLASDTCDDWKYKIDG